MRISTNTIYETGTNRIGELQTTLSRTQQQMATGRRILVPSDDPVAAAAALELTQAQSINSQFATNRQNALSALSLEEHVLASVTNLIEDVQTLSVSAGNGGMDNSQRKFLATELRGRFDDLMGLANTRDGAGNYLFAGFRTTAQPFEKTATGASYTGDQGTRMLQVGPMRQVAMNDTGDAVFLANKTGNGVYTPSAGPNSGSGTISTGSVVGAYTGHSYEIRFTSPTAYEIRDLTDTTAAPVPGTYASGEAISFGGLQLNISGSPATGDTFKVEPSTNENIFETLNNLIGILETPIVTGADKAAYTNGLAEAQRTLGNALDHVLTVRASVGSRLKELDSLDAQGEGRDLLYAKDLSTLQDLDYTKAITDLSKQQIMLEAAQQAFVQTSRLSLFSYM
jgi:flagellar hook-associated protein 3 FlgL